MSLCSAVSSSPSPAARLAAFARAQPTVVSKPSRALDRLTADHTVICTFERPPSTGQRRRVAQTTYWTRVT
jgi:hypothetical protein